jgi:hypothetical protein
MARSAITQLLPYTMMWPPDGANLRGLKSAATSEPNEVSFTVFIIYLMSQFQFFYYKMMQTKTAVLIFTLNGDQQNCHKYQIQFSM